MQCHVEGFFSCRFQSHTSCVQLVDAENGTVKNTFLGVSGIVKIGFYSIGWNIVVT